MILKKEHMQYLDLDMILNSFLQNEKKYQQWKKSRVIPSLLFILHGKYATRDHFP